MILFRYVTGVQFCARKAYLHERYIVIDIVKYIV